MTRRKQVWEAGGKNETLYHSIFENAVEGIFRSTPSGRFTEVNPALVHMLGYQSAAEVLALKLPEDLYVDPVERERLRVRYDVANILDGVEVRWKKRDGEQIVVSLHARAIRDVGGHVVCYEGMVQDITAHKQAKEVLQHSEERYRSLAVATAQIGGRPIPRDG